MIIPQHRVDTPSTCISSYDTAWNWDEIRRADGSHDPEFTSWILGKTRFDLETLPKRFIKEGEQPTLFRARRLGKTEWFRVSELFGISETRGAWEAFQLGIRNIDHIEIKGVVWPGTDAGKRLTDQDMEAIEAVIGRAVIEDIGRRVRDANSDLFASEKKA